VHPILIYTLTGCPYCARAKALLDAKGKTYREVDVSADYEERARVSGQTGHRTFPQIFFGDRFIGGCDDLHALDRAGELDPLLA
jgi:glutaredoxin 3